VLTREQILSGLRDRKSELQAKFFIEKIALFGSYARNEQTPESDIDVLVEFRQPVGIEFIDLGIYLEQCFQKPVDVVTKKALKKSLVPFVERDLIYV
jgi:predicted nucleotidyltransferase